MDYETPITFSNKEIEFWTKIYNDRVKNQTGEGMVKTFKGKQFMKGEGFREFMKTYAFPILKYFGKRGASSLMDFGSDVIAGENVKESLKKRGKSLAQTIASDVGDRATRFAQTGKGRRKRGLLLNTVLRKTKSRKKRRNSRKSGKKKQTKRRAKRSIKNRKVKSIFQS